MGLREYLSDAWQYVVRYMPVSRKRYEALETGLGETSKRLETANGDVQRLIAEKKEMEKGLEGLTQEYRLVVSRNEELETHVVRYESELRQLNSLVTEQSVNIERQTKETERLSGELDRANNIAADIRRRYLLSKIAGGADPRIVGFPEDLAGVVAGLRLSSESISLTNSRLASESRSIRKALEVFREGAYGVVIDAFESELDGDLAFVYMGRTQSKVSRTFSDVIGLNANDFRDEKGRHPYVKLSRLLSAEGRKKLVSNMKENDRGYFKAKVNDRLVDLRVDVLRDSEKKIKGLVFYTREHHIFDRRGIDRENYLTAMFNSINNLVDETVINQAGRDSEVVI